MFVQQIRQALRNFEWASAFAFRLRTLSSHERTLQRAVYLVLLSICSAAVLVATENGSLGQVKQYTCLL